jgi:hypothetical protein
LWPMAGDDRHRRWRSGVAARACASFDCVKFTDGIEVVRLQA